MSAYLELPAVLAAMAVFAWCLRRVKLPVPLQTIEKIGSYRTSKEKLKALNKRLEALRLPFSAEQFSAGKVVLTVLSAITGVLLLWNRQMEGFFFLFTSPMAGRLPELILTTLEKKRKEEIQRDFPLMVDQVRIYAKAAGYYHALKIVAQATRGVLGREMAVLSAEMELVGVMEALNNFADRCGVPEISDFARIILVEQRTGADIREILLKYSRIARQKMTSNIKRKIKLQPIIMSFLPGVLLILFMLMFIVPMVTGITDQLNQIK